MRTAHIVATASAIALVTVGCASDDSDQDGQAAAADTQNSAEPEAVEADVDSVEEPAEEADEPTSEPDTKEPELEVNERGNLEKEIGETAGVMADQGSDPYMEFTVTEIVTDGQCTAEFAEPPENGSSCSLSSRSRRRARAAGRTTRKAWASTSPLTTSRSSVPTG